MLPWLEDPWNDFAARLEQGRLPHALLLSGPAGTGKRQLAERMVAGLLCKRGGPEACGECRSCRLLDGGAHPDHFTVRPEPDKREITIDAIRGLNAGLVLTTTISPRKVALVEPAEAMNRNAANALLKTLEEPPGHAVMILVADDASRLPATILSRCQALLVHAPERNLAVGWLAAEAGLDEASARLALEATADSPLRARTLVEEELLDRYRALRDALEGLVGKPSRAAALAQSLQDLDGTHTWTWLSLAASGALASVLGATDAAWPETDHDLPVDRLATLQLRADRNRGFLASTVRQDLLLKEWLLEWARLPARQPIR